ncbi:hypothetical protein EWM64_g6918 [Hericium alpestre]|uniref:HMG box domain-containing protein n=1 Tax=Hericium alpestre TaxID=135208 RepID=A0A4Y9ZTE4_9AGAM|nr:hypothetical protein EWM64_g6918 [Hericium alpestre]
MPVARVKSSKNKDDGHIKRVPNCFILYRRALIHGNVSGTTLVRVDDEGRPVQQSVLSKAIKRLWHDLSEEDKAPWREEFRRLKAQQLIDHPDYKYHPTQKQKAGNVKGRKAAGSQSQPRRHESDPAPSRPPSAPMAALPSSVPFLYHQPGAQYQMPPSAGRSFAYPGAPAYPAAGHYPQSIAPPASQPGPSQMSQQTAYHPTYLGLPDTYPARRYDPQFFPPAGQPGPSQISWPIAPQPTYPGLRLPAPTYPAHRAEPRFFSPAAGQTAFAPMPAPTAPHPQYSGPPAPSYPANRVDTQYFSPPAGQTGSMPTPPPAAPRLPFPIQPKAAAPPTPVLPAALIAPPVPAENVDVHVGEHELPVCLSGDDDAFLAEMDRLLGRRGTPSTSTTLQCESSLGPHVLYLCLAYSLSYPMVTYYTYCTCYRLPLLLFIVVTWLASAYYTLLLSYLHVSAPFN